MNTAFADRLATRGMPRTTLALAFAAAACAAVPAGAQTVAARQQVPAAIVLDVPSNPDHAEPSQLPVVSYEYDAAATRLTYTRAYDSAVTGTITLTNTGEPVPIASPSLLKWVTITETNGADKVFRRVTFRDVRVTGIARDGNARLVTFTAGSATARSR